MDWHDVVVDWLIAGEIHPDQERFAEDTWQTIASPPGEAAFILLDFSGIARSVLMDLIALDCRVTSARQKVCFASPLGEAANILVVMMVLIDRA
eukprot:scaffold1274_cov221-Skeletonema_marinoi.AAC.1